MEPKVPIQYSQLSLQRVVVMVLLKIKQAVLVVLVVVLLIQVAVLVQVTHLQLHHHKEAMVVMHLLEPPAIQVPVVVVPHLPVVTVQALTVVLVVLEQLLQFLVLQ